MKKNQFWSQTLWLEFLGFIFESMSITVSINKKKEKNIISKVNRLLYKDAP